MEREERYRRKIRFYHASPRRFRCGTILTGGRPGGFGSEHPNVCLTTGTAPHGTVMREALEGDWFVYEVEPLYGVGYVEGNAELQTRAARVLKMVGRARGMSEHAAKRRGGRRVMEEWKRLPGRCYESTGGSESSMVVARLPMRGVKVMPRDVSRGKRR